jgi:ATP-dependent RNA helicase DeaD
LQVSETAASVGPEARSDYVSEASFDDFALSEPVRRGIAERGYSRPTPVQTATVRPILAGRDVIVRSKTGTGKTAAFAIPILERIPEGRGCPSTLVMAPTRELALQVAEEFVALGKHKGLRVVTIYGGASMSDQLDALKAGAEIVVGTPGRIYDHIRRRTLDLSKVMVSVLDEADEMLNMGFFEEVTRILDHLPDACQQLLFSATVPADIEQIIHDYLTDPETILLSGDEYSVENIRNVLYHTNDAYPKPRNLLYMIEMEEPESAIVFCNTRSDTSLVTAVLNRNGYDAELLNGELPQKERERVMAKVKRGEVRFMVATDIAARGIDISDLSHVVNYSLPEDPAVYLHRVGRTGRIGKKGTALSLVTGAEGITLGILQKKFGIAFEEKQMPTPEEARRLWTERHVAELREAMSASIFEGFIPLAQQIKERGDADHLFAFALKYFFTHHRMDRVADLAKAVHKKEEHERKEHRTEGRREDRPAGRERRDRRDRRDGREEREARLPREAREDRPPPEGREARPQRKAEDRPPREEREARPPREAREDRPPREEREARPPREAREDRPPREEREARAARQEAEAPAPREEREVRVTRVEREVPATREPRREPRARRDLEGPPPGAAPEGIEAGGDGLRPGRSRIFLNAGEQDGADEAKVREAVGTLAPGADLLGVEVRRTSSFLEVKPEALDGVVAALNGKDAFGKPLVAERARRRRR